MKLVKSIFTLLFVSAAILSLQAQSAADEKAIRTLISDGMNAYFKGDIDKMVSYYTDNAVVIDWMGNVTTGRDALRASTQQALQYEKPNPDNFHYDVKSVRFLSPDVSVVQMDLHGVSTMDGKEQEWKGVDVIIVVRKNGKWLVDHDQSTPVMPMPGK